MQENYETNDIQSFLGMAEVRDFIEIVAGYGHSDVDIAKLLHVTVGDLGEFLRNNTGFRHRLEVIRLKPYENYMKALDKSALGYDVEEIEYGYTKENKKIRVKSKTRHIPPNLNSLKYILDNRQSQLWKSRVEIMEAEPMQSKEIVALDQVLGEMSEDVREVFLKHLGKVVDGE